jgi:hypothetical protein
MYIYYTPDDDGTVVLHHYDCFVQPTAAVLKAVDTFMRLHDRHVSVATPGRQLTMPRRAHPVTGVDEQAQEVLSVPAGETVVEVTVTRTMGLGGAGWSSPHDDPGMGGGFDGMSPCTTYQQDVSMDEHYSLPAMAAPQPTNFGPPSLPVGWTVHTSDHGVTRGKHFFHHAASGASVWTTAEVEELDRPLP